MNKTRLYCILPSGNRSEFDGINQLLVERKVPSKFYDLSSGGRMYVILDPTNLPKDKHGYYLGTTYRYSLHCFLGDELDYFTVTNVGVIYGGEDE